MKISLLERALMLQSLELRNTSSTTGSSITKIPHQVNSVLNTSLIRKENLDRELKDIFGRFEIFEKRFISFIDSSCEGATMIPNKKNLITQLLGSMESLFQEFIHMLHEREATESYRESSMQSLVSYAENITSMVITPIEVKYLIYKKHHPHDIKYAVKEELMKNLKRDFWLFIQQINQILQTRGL